MTALVSLFASGLSNCLGNPGYLNRSVPTSSRLCDNSLSVDMPVPQPQQTRPDQGLTLSRISKTQEQQGSLMGHHHVRMRQTHWTVPFQARDDLFQSSETPQKGLPWTLQTDRPECVADMSPASASSPDSSLVATVVTSVGGA